MKSAMSISSFPLPWAMDLSRGTSACRLRTPTVLMGTSGSAGRTGNAGASGDVAGQRGTDAGLLVVLAPLGSCAAALGGWRIKLANLDCSSPPARRKNRRVSSAFLVF